MIFLPVLALLCSISFGAQVEKNEHGVVIIARPEEGEQVVITPTTIPGIENHWVVHPDAIREANARVAELEPYVEATQKLKEQVAACDNDRTQEASAHQDTAHDLSVCKGALKECRRERWRAFFMGTGTGGAIVTVVVILLVL